MRQQIIRQVPAVPPGGSETRRGGRGEAWGVGLLLLGFAAVNLLTATRYPFVWIDEVMYADPAVNLYLGHGFTSSAWYVQSSQEFWAGNVPLPSLSLFLWMKLFGFSILTIRSFNYGCLIACGWLLWRSCLRLELVASARMRLLLLGLVVGGYSVIFAYRSARPDGLAMLVACLFLYAHGARREWRALLSFFILGLAAPWAGLQLLPLLGAGGLLLLLYLGRPFLPRLLAAWGGVAVGLGALVCFYAAHGVLGQFLKSIRQHTGVGFLEMLLSGHFRHHNVIPKDFSFMVLLLLAVLLVLWQFQRGAFRPRSMLGFGVVWSVVISLVLLLAGKFPTYYGWMTYIPLSLCVCATLPSDSLTGLMAWVARLLIAAAVLAGVGLHAVTAAYDWPERDYGHVEKLVTENVSASDVMYGEFATYYAAKSRAAKVFMPFYLPAFRPDEKAEVSVLVIYPSSLAEVTNLIGGAWVDTGRGHTPRRAPLFGAEWGMGFLGVPDYRLEVYRRRGLEP